MHFLHVTGCSPRHLLALALLATRLGPCALQGLKAEPSCQACSWVLGSDALLVAAGPGVWPLGSRGAVVRATPHMEWVLVPLPPHTVGLEFGLGGAQREGQ